MAFGSYLQWAEWSKVKAKQSMQSGEGLKWDVNGGTETWIGVLGEGRSE